MGYAAVAFTELEGLAGTSFPNMGGSKTSSCIWDLN